MRYLLVGDNRKTIFIEDEISENAIYYNPSENKWCEGTYKLWECKIGFDPSEPPDSIYRYGNIPSIETITKAEAEQFIGRKITEEEIAEPFEKIEKEYQEYLAKSRKDSSNKN